jgi:hypothetical protein
MPLVTIRNAFHKTAVDVYPAVDGSLSKQQVTRMMQALCGARWQLNPLVPNCMCGGLAKFEADGGRLEVVDGRVYYRRASAAE